MTYNTIGDLRQHFSNLQTNARLKTDLNTLVQELTTGEKADLTQHLGAGQVNLAGIDRQLSMLERAERANLETGQLLGVMQTALSSVDSNRETASSTFLTINLSSSMSQINNASFVAEQSFEATVNALNTRFGDRAVFGGADTSTPPLIAAELILDELRTVTAGLTSGTDVSAAVDNFFDTPGGGFETIAYVGDSVGLMSRPADVSENVEIGVRADEQAVRDVLKALAKGTLAGDTGLVLSLTDRQDLQKEAGVDLLSASGPLTEAQARLGYVEGRVAEAAVRISAQMTSYGIARNDLVSADPFDTASRLEAVQMQLETHYTLTARLSRLSLTEYLR